MVQPVWADVNLDVNLIINLSRHPLIRVAGFIMHSAIALVINGLL
jgi:hypothetical protein